MKLRLLYFFVCYFFFITASAQMIDEKNFVQYSKKDGLSSNNITAITQDAFGYIWVATLKGLNRFDGTSFQQFYSDSSRNSIPEDFVHRLRWLDKERLAVITIGGLHIINSRTLEQCNIAIPPDSLKDHLPVNRAMDAFADKNGNIFIATGTGFYHLNSKDELMFRYDHYSSKYLEERKVTAFAINIIPLEENILFIATFKGPFLYYIDKKDFHPIGNHDPVFYQQIGVPGKSVTIAYADQYSFCSIETGEEKISWFDSKKKIKYDIKAPFKISDNIDGGITSRLIMLNDTLFAINSNQSGFFVGRFSRSAGYKILPAIYFKGFFCNSFLIDKNQQLWIATDKGLFREKKSAAVIEQITTGSSFTNEIYTVAVSNNKLFGGTIGQGLLIFERDSLKQIGQLNFKDHRKDLAHANHILQVNPVHTDTLFVAIPALWLNTKDLTIGQLSIAWPDSNTKSLDLIFQDSRNNVFLKEDQKNRFYYRKSNERSFSVLDYRSDLEKIGFDINSMAEDPDGNIWFAGMGLMRYNYKAQKFDLLLDSFPSIKLPRRGISSNLIFDNSDIYFGLHANGLVIYDQKQKRFSQITRTDGLPDNHILALYLHNGKLWMATENGLASYHLTTKEISSFGTTDGIPLYSGSKYLLYYDSTHQQLYGAFKNTIFRFNPDKLTKNNIPPVFNIESIVIAGNETIYHPVNNVKLTYDQNNIVLNLASVNFEDASQQQFAYRIVVHGDEPWLTLGAQRSIIFSNLSPGNHRLQVKVFIRNQSWPDQVKEIILLVRPPFWKTIWFYILAALVIAIAFYYLHRRRINQITQRADIDKQLAQSEMKALHAQMNPDFIFNCLNSIREMILNNENEQASLYLSKFARLIRITLNQSSKPFVSLSDTVDYLERYIEMEKIRSSHFTYTIDLGDDLQLKEIMLPAMLIQPFIENAIWHGTLLKKNLDVHVSFRKKGNELVCVVEDNGIGIEESLQKKENTATQPSVGIANIRQRIELLNEKYNLQSTVIIQDKKALTPTNGTGTVVTLHLPIKTNESLWTN